MKFKSFCNVRVSVGSQDTNIVGAYLICGTSFDDYSSCCRCTHCQLSVLVCYSCQGKTTIKYVCELCKKHREGGRPLTFREDGQLQLFDSLEPGEVEQALPSVHVAPSSIISGTHGKGRTASLAKKLKNISEFVFINGPHELPFIYHTTEQTTTHQQPPPPDKCKKRFTWLIDSNTLSNSSSWRVVEEPFEPFDPLQYQQQTDGFDESYKFLKYVISKLGTFDGTLGFSPGSALVAMFLEQQQRTCKMKDFRFRRLVFRIFCSICKFWEGNDMVPIPSYFSVMEGERIGR